MTHLDLFKLIAEYEGYSTGELSVKTGIERETLKETMRRCERLGLGEYTIQDGMYHFWLSAKGKSAYQVLRSLEQG